MLDVVRTSARRRLDRRLCGSDAQDRFAVPPKGWIRAIRDALGMTGAQLGRRLGITAQGVLSLEQSEALGTMQIKSLRNAAEALDCVLVYALVPKTSLEETVGVRAQEIARVAVDRVGHTMALEDQAVGGSDRRGHIQRYIDTALRDRDLWADR